MKKYLPTLSTCLAFLFPVFTRAQICNPSGNVILFSNYDGGDLVIDVDVNIPNLKIGIVSYEAVKVTITGTYAGNVTAVDYSGYNNSPNTNCTPSVSTTTISGFAAATIHTIPAATLSDPGGYPYIICAYNCGGTTGGCNTTAQVEHYYQTMFGGTLYFHLAQYPCWGGTTRYVSAGGNCCLAPSAAPVAAFSLSTDTLCAGDCLALTDMSTNSPTSWNWTLSGSTPGSSSLQHPTACYNTPGSYNITLQATNGIGTDVITQSIIVYGANVATSQSGTTMTAAATGASYQWIQCGGSPIAGATSQSYSAVTNGLYAVIVTENGCSDTSACMNITSVGLGEIYTGEEIKLYPNPSTGRFIIEDKFGVFAQAGISIVNALGEQVYTGQLNKKQEIDLSAVPSGIYFVSIQTSEGKLLKKLVIED